MFISGGCGHRPVSLSLLTNSVCESFPSVNAFCEHTKDISLLLIYVLCLRSVGSWSLLGMLAVERSALFPISAPAVCGLSSNVASGYADGTLLLRQNLDLLVDHLYERNFP